MTKLGNNLDLNGNQLIRSRLENSSDTPASPSVGQVYFDTLSLTFKGWNGSTWVRMDTGHAVVTPAANSIPLADSSGKIADGWLPTTIARTSDITTHASVKDGIHGLSNPSGFTLTIPATGTAALRSSPATANRVAFWGDAASVNHDANLTWDPTNQWMNFGAKDNGGGFYVPFRILDSGGTGRTVLGVSNASTPDVLLNMPTGQALRVLYNAATEVARFNNTGLLVGKTSGLTGAGDIDAAGNVRGASFRVGLNQVVGARATGWALPTGTLTRTTFDPSTVTLVNLAQRLAALITDLFSTHGMIGA